MILFRDAIAVQNQKTRGVIKMNIFKKTAGTITICCSLIFTNCSINWFCFDLEMLILSHFLLNSLTPANPHYCSQNPERPVTISSSISGYVNEDRNCYFKFYYDNSGDTDLSISLINIQGDTDLYTGILNDSTGGAVAYEECGPETPGGGWAACSRKGESVGEYVSVNIPSMNENTDGNFRIIVVYGKNCGSGRCEFELLTESASR